MAYSYGGNLPSGYFFTWGVSPFTGSLTGLVLESTTIGAKNLINGIVMNESGQRIFERFDDVITEVSFEGKIAGGTVPSPGTLISFKSVSYVVDTFDIKAKNNGFVDYSMKAHTSQYLGI